MPAATPAVAAASGRQAWRQLMRNTNILQKHQFPRAASSLSASSPKAFVPRRAGVSQSLFQREQQPSSSSYRSYSSQGGNSSPPPPKNPNQIKFWPFVIVIGFGSTGYILLVNRRKEMPPTTSKNGSSKPTPTFSPSDVTVLFVLGGPGAGKGTQCANLVKDFSFTHLSAGDLLRAEQDRPGSQYGQLIKDCIKNGEIVPMEVTVALLENAMKDTITSKSQKKARFLIDGFPRKMDQAFKFEEVVCPARLVLFYDCPEETMEKRLLERGKTSGRADDNAESIRKRFRVFIETSMPVVNHYEKEGRVIKVDSTPSPEEVYKDTREKLIKKLGENF
ncbi:adenylate kinase-domain-containing protein [Podospora fimiseda]|uniref:Uridylate kinase n=1 Tax=Podospora fimiseda TaxID=252190 RepID=A0AAN7H099_9PEZI|nr:adenylate kinase-domain-containing protein [Podospora fimiseda]